MRLDIPGPGNAYLFFFFLHPQKQQHAAEHVERPLAATGPPDWVGGDWCHGEVWAKHSLQLRTRGAPGHVFIPEP